MRLLRNRRCISCLHIDLSGGSGSGLISDHKYVTTYNSASETRIQLESGVGLFRANKGLIDSRTLGVKRQAPGDRLIQNLGEPTAYGIDEPRGVAGGVSPDTCLICASVGRCSEDVSGLVVT